MQFVTIRAAKTRLSRLIEAALAGEEVVTSRGNTPVVRPVSITGHPFQLGLLAGQVGPGPNFLAPANEDELAFWEGGG